MIRGIAILAGMLAASSAALTAPPNDQPAELAGRTAGKPQRCIPFDPRQLFNVSRSDSHVLLYEHGDKIWATRLDPSCGFEAGRTVTQDAIANNACKGDLVRMGGRITLIPFGELCMLGDFTLYSGPAK
jgi:hypothetical protein